jgi:lambda family phage portal protein
MISHLPSTVAAGQALVAQRATFATMNHPRASRAASAWIASVLGGGLLPMSEHQSAAMQARIDRLWNSWAQVQDWAGLLRLLARSEFTVGEGLALMRIEPTAGSPVPLRIQPLDARQLDPTVNRELPGGGRIVQGVELDGSDRIVGYWLLPRLPEDGWPAAVAPVRVPAADVIHLFEQLSPGQRRGLSRLAPALTRLASLDAYEDAEVARAQASACLAGFIRMVGDLHDPGAGPIPGLPTADADVAEAAFEPGSFSRLRPGEDVQFSTFEPPRSADAFIKTQLHAIASGIGLTYEQLSGDLSGVNYSSIRAGRLEHQRYASQIQDLLIAKLCAPVWRRFIATATLSGALPAEPSDSLFAVTWARPAWSHVDPERERKAEIMAVEAGFTSRSAIVRSHGLDPDLVDAERQQDLQRERALGLPSAEPTRERPGASALVEEEDAGT